MDFNDVSGFISTKQKAVLISQYYVIIKQYPQIIYFEMPPKITKHFPFF